MSIPRIIHQTWKDHWPHPALGRCMESFRFMNPGWECRFYTDADCVRWVSQRCPHLLPAYNGYQTGIHRADFFRILVLYFDGGVYVDLDVECLRPLDDLLSHLPGGKTVYLTRDHPIHERIHFARREMWMNDFMIAAPGDPLVGEILNWMLHSPPSSGASANAVMETGPGVISSVLEMLGGPDRVPSLGLMPTPWIHPLPDMNCGFPEKHYYAEAIGSRAWLQRECFVVHYWFHTWVGTQTNTLTRYSDVLLSSRGEQVERKLRWLLGPEPTELESLCACAVTEFAEQGGSICLDWRGITGSLVEAFIRVLVLSGLHPRVFTNGEFPGDDVAYREAAVTLMEIGATSRNGVPPGPLLWVGSVAPPEDVMKNREGIVLGPDVRGGERIGSAGEFHLTEVWPTSAGVPQVLHLFPRDEPFAQAISAHFGVIGYETKLWSSAEVRGILQDHSLGTWNLEHMLELDQEVGAALLILKAHGGVVFEGDSKTAASQAEKPFRGNVSVENESHWLFACPAGSPVLDGGFEQWFEARLRTEPERAEQFKSSKSLEMDVRAGLRLREFLTMRLRAMHLHGRGRSFQAKKAAIFEP